MTAQRTLSRRTLNRLAWLLSERRDAALETAEAFFSEAVEAQATADVSDRLDLSSPIGTAAEESYALAERAFDTAREANEALRRIADGTYGVCRQCGGAIPCARLQALPSTTTCVGCAEPGHRRQISPAQLDRISA